MREVGHELFSSLSDPVVVASKSLPEGVDVVEQNLGSAVVEFAEGIQHVLFFLCSPLSLSNMARC